MATTENYKLVSGKHAGFDADGNPKTFVPGDWLKLTPEQAKNFAGKVKSEKILKAEADLAMAGFGDDAVATSATPAMDASRLQPYAPNGPVDVKTQEAGDEEEARAAVSGDTVKPIDNSKAAAKEEAAAPKAAVSPVAKA